MGETGHADKGTTLTDENMVQQPTIHSSCVQPAKSPLCSNHDNGVELCRTVGRNDETIIMTCSLWSKWNHAHTYLRRCACVLCGVGWLPSMLASSRRMKTQVAANALPPPLCCQQMVAVAIKRSANRIILIIIYRLSERIQIMLYWNTHRRRNSDFYI